VQPWIKGAGLAKERDIVECVKEHGEGGSFAPKKANSFTIQQSMTLKKMNFQ
jgi:hypothetical protein